jgi:hypothetical protein
MLVALMEQFGLVARLASSRFSSAQMPIGLSLFVEVDEAATNSPASTNGRTDNIPPPAAEDGHGLRSDKRRYLVPSLLNATSLDPKSTAVRLFSTQAFERHVKFIVARTGGETQVPAGLFDRLLGKAVLWSQKTHGAEPPVLRKSEAVLWFGALPVYICLTASTIAIKVATAAQTKGDGAAAQTWWDPSHGADRIFRLIQEVSRNHLRGRIQPRNVLGAAAPPETGTIGDADGDTNPLAIFLSAARTADAAGRVLAADRVFAEGVHDYQTVIHNRKVNLETLDCDAAAAVALKRWAGAIQQQQQQQPTRPGAKTLAVMIIVVSSDSLQKLATDAAAGTGDDGVLTEWMVGTYLERMKLCRLFVIRRDAQCVEAANLIPPQASVPVSATANVSQILEAAGIEPTSLDPVEPSIRTLTGQLVSRPAGEQLCDWWKVEGGNDQEAHASDTAVVIPLEVELARHAAPVRENGRYKCPVCRQESATVSALPVGIPAEITRDFTCVVCFKHHGEIDGDDTAAAAAASDNYSCQIGVLGNCRHAKVCLVCLDESAKSSLSVRTLRRGTVQIRTALWGTVGQLKELIAGVLAVGDESSTFTAATVALAFQGALLLDRQSLEECGIRANDTLVQVPPGCDTVGFGTGGGAAAATSSSTESASLPSGQYRPVTAASSSSSLFPRWSKPFETEEPQYSAHVVESKCEHSVVLTLMRPDRSQHFGFPPPLSLITSTVPSAETAPALDYIFGAVSAAVRIDAIGSTSHGPDQAVTVEFLHHRYQPTELYVCVWKDSPTGPTNPQIGALAPGQISDTHATATLQPPYTIAVICEKRPYAELEVGKTGGKIVGPLGVTVTVDAGVLSEPQMIGIAIPGEARDRSLNHVTPIVELLPDGSEFEQPITVTLPHHLAGGWEDGEVDFEIHTANSPFWCTESTDDSAPRCASNGDECPILDTAGSAAKQITFSTRHFTLFGAIAKKMGGGGALVGTAAAIAGVAAVGMSLWSWAKTVEFGCFLHVSKNFSECRVIVGLRMMDGGYEITEDSLAVKYRIYSRERLLLIDSGIVHSSSAAVCVKLVSDVTGDEVKVTKPVRIPTQGNTYCRNLVWNLASEHESSIQLVVCEAGESQHEELFSCGVSRQEIEDRFGAVVSTAGDAVQQQAVDTTDAPSELLLAIQAGDDAAVKLILARPSAEETGDKFVPIKSRGGGIVLQSCLPHEWGLLDLDQADWDLRYKITQEYIQVQIDGARRQVEQLRQQAAALDSAKDSYEAAALTITTDPNFTALVETLSGMVTRVDHRNQGTNAMQRSSDIREVFRDAQVVVRNRKFATLLEQLEKITRCKCTMAPCKKVFRCLEKMGLDPHCQWDAKTLSDVVRGNAEMDAGIDAGLMLVKLLMAIDRGDPPEAAHSPYAETGGQRIMKALGDDSIVIVGVKNRWKEDAAGWRDAQIKFYFASDANKHVCELQLVHPLLMNVRSAMGLHEVYAKSRNACELLDAIGEPPFSQAGGRAMADSAGEDSRGPPDHEDSIWP